MTFTRPPRFHKNFNVCFLAKRMQLLERALMKFVRLLPHSPGKADFRTVTMREHVVGGRERVFRWSDLQRAALGKLDLYSTADLKV